MMLTPTCERIAAAPREKREAQREGESEREERGGRKREERERGRPHTHSAKKKKTCTHNNKINSSSSTDTPHQQSHPWKKNTHTNTKDFPQAPPSTSQLAGGAMQQKPQQKSNKNLHAVKFLALLRWKARMESKTKKKKMIIRKERGCWMNLLLLCEGQQSSG